MRQIAIRRSRNGTLDTLKIMMDIARAGSSNSYLRQFVVGVPHTQWDGVLRQHWIYVPEENETLRTIQTQVLNLLQYNKLLGDCDDAAIVVMACALASNIQARYVAVRPPEESEFSHVFVECAHRIGQPVRIDPTAPVTADYTNWERLVFP